VKIGTSTNVPARIKQLEATYKRPLALLGTMEGDRDEEQAVHARFAHLRFGRTEQFRPAPELMEFIGKPLLVGANPDAVEAMEGHAKPIVFQMRGSPEYKAWLEDVARFDGLPVASLFARSLVRYAKSIGFTEPPPER
jgi:hypothetical protein